MKSLFEQLDNGYFVRKIKISVSFEKNTKKPLRGGIG
jgi:hypothetical protein